ncbi:unnamed protein product [Medioppia subpectinata]|uniref:Uncharacterized protein n=1 Tax=Medioppia subpectinata TaxID=1979941 RepID=A0A7R9KKN8_9ACAR|nr:unnamed protein product [Medioppia subpectinata]CAG2105372.1 unnamed protein product [Medioppia subpectinata]
MKLGFDLAYTLGGWPGPTWTIPVSVDTFEQTFDLVRAFDITSSPQNSLTFNTNNVHGSGHVLAANVATTRSVDDINTRDSRRTCPKWLNTRLMVVSNTCRQCHCVPSLTITSNRVPYIVSTRWPPLPTDPMLNFMLCVLRTVLAVIPLAGALLCFESTLESTYRPLDQTIGLRQTFPVMSDIDEDVNFLCCLPVDSFARFTTDDESVITLSLLKLLKQLKRLQNK